MDKIASPNRQRKEKIVAKFVEKVDKSKGVVFAGYQGLTHKQMEGLKKKVQRLNADFVATKNSLLKISLDQSKNPNVKTTPDTKLPELNGATATLFVYGDPVLPLKELAKLIKEFTSADKDKVVVGGPSIKFGILDGKALTSEELLKLSTLPSREILLAMLSANLKSPIFGLHRALNWNLQKFVMTLKAIEAKKTQTTQLKN